MKKHVTQCSGVTQWCIFNSFWTTVELSGAAWKTTKASVSGHINIHPRRAIMSCATEFVYRWWQRCQQKIEVQWSISWCNLGAVCLKSLKLRQYNQCNNATFGDMRWVEQLRSVFLLIVLQQQNKQQHTGPCLSDRPCFIFMNRAQKAVIFFFFFWSEAPRIENITSTARL